MCVLIGSTLVSTRGRKATGSASCNWGSVVVGGGGGICSLSMFLVSQCAGLVVLKQQDSLPEGPVDSLGERHC